MIYFIQDETTLAIKIGFTAGDDAADRLAALQTGNPSPLRLLMTMAGDQAGERELHRRFASLRGLGEWFSPGPDLLAFLIGTKAIDAFASGLDSYWCNPVSDRKVLLHACPYCHDSPLILTASEHRTGTAPSATSFWRLRCPSGCSFGLVLQLYSHYPGFGLFLLDPNEIDIPDLDIWPEEAVTP